MSMLGGFAYASLRGSMSSARSTMTDELHALEADAGGHKTSHTGWAKNSEAKRAW